MVAEKEGMARVAGKGDGMRPDSLNNLLLSGAQFLTDLSKILSQSAQTGPKPIGQQIDTLIQRNEKTGRSYLKIPLPEAETIKDIFSTFGELVTKTMQIRDNSL